MNRRGSSAVAAPSSTERDTAVSRRASVQRPGTSPSRIKDGGGGGGNAQGADGDLTDEWNRNPYKEKKAFQKPNLNFNFKLPGKNVGDGKREEWSALFDKPLESFIYPSLQCVQGIITAPNKISEYETKKREWLAASVASTTETTSNATSTAPPPADSADGGESSSFKNKYKDIKLKQNPEQEAKLDLKWGINVVKQSEHRKVAAISAEMAERNTFYNDIDVKGEEFLRTRLKDNFEVWKVEEKKKKAAVKKAGTQRRAGVALSKKHRG